uniref:Uncharacterized protein n=1 Tax=Arundo donax TaxID=35708 RepID=A0A0A9E225_ARUDO
MFTFWHHHMNIKELQLKERFTARGNATCERKVEYSQHVKLSIIGQPLMFESNWQ